MKPKRHQDKYKDPRWQKKRLEIMERDNFTCQSCGDTESTLNVHHTYYEKGKKPWEYPDVTLITWCENCHKDRHGIQQDLNVIISKLDIGRLHHLLSFLELSPIEILDAFGDYRGIPIDLESVGDFIRALGFAYYWGKRII